MDPFSEFIFSLPPLASIAIVAFGVTLFTSLVYKFVTDQNMMKTLRKELKDLQKLMKEHRDKPEKMMSIQKQAMEKNMEYMKHSMKPTLFTMIPLILLFGWLNSHIAYYPIMPDTTFEVWAEMKSGIEGMVDIEVTPDVPGFEILDGRTKEISDGKVSWKLRGPEGEYVLKYIYDGAEAQQELLITDEREYKNPIQQSKSDAFKSLHIDNERVEPLSFLGLGWSWIWSYILLSILFSTVIRKVMKIH